MIHSADETAAVIAHTKKWIVEVVVGCNFCPFAAREVKSDRVHYQVSAANGMAEALESFQRECERLDRDGEIATTLLIFPGGFSDFGDYLDLLALAEKLLAKSGYEGVYQVASFHPEYRFAKTKADDAANYTNRSIYPMLHLLREEQVEKALEHYPHPEKIPADNVNFARAKGEAYMRLLRESCMGEK
ncbi:MAG: DUF1415 domain-containing protein [Puia sp.]|nr:DUF1415 domain-containing protein [Puia sp.]